jgi:hypothetical protein
MQIEIERLEGATLPLIERLPAFQLARMEGYNGIGKSLTIRLLQLAVGRQTFHQTRTWETFVEGVGRLRIRALGLDGADEIIWHIDAADLPSEPSEVSDNWFTITIDGKRSHLSDVARLLSVHRLPGDTGLAETLGEQIEADRRTFTDWHRRLTGEGGPLVQTLDLLDQVQAILQRVDRSRILSVRGEVLEATTELERHREQLRMAIARQSALARARALAQRLAEYAKFGADVDAQAGQVEAELVALQDQRATVNDALSDLETAAARSEEARKRIKTVRKRLENHFAHLSVERMREADLLQRAQIADVEARDNALEVTRSELSNLVERRAALDATPLVHGLVEQIRRLLEHAEAEGLGAQILLGEAASAEVLTVAELRARLEAREQELAGVEPTAEGQALAQAVESASSRIEALEQLPPVQAEIERRLRLIGTAEAEIQELVGAADTDVIAEVDEKRRELTSLDERAASLARERTVLAIRKEAIGGGRTPAETEAEYRALLAEVGVDETELDEAATKQDESVRLLQAAHHQAQVHATAARETAAVLDEELRRVVNTLTDDGAFAWLSTVHTLPRADQQIEAQLAALEAISRSVAGAIERAGAVQGQMAGIEVALERLAARLKGREESGGRRYAEEVTRGYGEEFRGWFDDRLVRDTLLPDAKQIVAVDLRSQQLDVEWVTKDGARRSRPLDAFSRGEQAFAYTRARLASLDAVDTRARNRLIVLDEFGAFIARDRLQALVDLLKERQQRIPNDQVLLILPIAADYNEQMKTAITREKERLEPIIKELAETGFFAVEL